MKKAYIHIVFDLKLLNLQSTTVSQTITIFLCWFTGGQTDIHRFLVLMGNLFKIGFQDSNELTYIYHQENFEVNKEELHLLSVMEMKRKTFTSRVSMQAIPQGERKCMQCAHEWYCCVSRLSSP